MFKEPKTHILIIITLVFGILFFYSSFLSIKIDCENLNKIIYIPKNSTASDVAKIFQDELCINSRLFKIATIITFNQKNIKPGRYNLNGISTIRELIRMISSVSKDRIKFTIIEGWNINKIANELQNRMRIDKNLFIYLCNNKSFIRKLRIYDSPTSLEGFLYPDTYILLNTFTEDDILKVFVERFKEVYVKEVNPKLKNKNLSTLEIITLASIIQAEAMYEDEMPIISNVYHNRLNLNMKLEADPTILYYMSASDREIFNSNKKIFKKYRNMLSPYNTYLNIGLPMGPINNPGLTALVSAVEPVDTNKVLLYFVANGKGRHIFNETLTKHKRAIHKVKYGY